MNRMDVQRNSKISADSNKNRHSNRSSILSIERISDQRPSLGKKVSLVNAMDLQIPYQTNNSTHNELLEKQLANRFSSSKRSSNKQPYSFQPNIQQKDLNRTSNYKIKHQCVCTEQQCHQHHCACYLTPNQICIIGQCCPKCIFSKNQFFKNTRGYKLQKEKQQKASEGQQSDILQLIKGKNYKNMHYIKQVYANQPSIVDLVFCTCKKSHCKKNYCICFQKNIKCGKFCSCVQCNNEDHLGDPQQQEQRRWQRYATYIPQQQNQGNIRIDHDIEQFIQNEMLGQDEQFNQKMQFQPVNFDNYI